MIQGHGSLITEVDEDGYDLNFMTTEEILRQLMKFGFYIVYDVKKNLPKDIFVYLSKIEDFGYDKITRVALESFDSNGNKIWKPTIIVMKSEHNPDLLTFDCKVTRVVFDKKLEDNYIMNITHEPGMEWDWLNYIANISDILDENVHPSNEFDLISIPKSFFPNPYQGELTPYDDDSEEDDSGDAEGGLTEYGSEVVDEP